jgi:hypothetical protein
MGLPITSREGTGCPARQSMHACLVTNTIHLAIRHGRVGACDLLVTIEDRTLTGISDPLWGAAIASTEKGERWPGCLFGPVSGNVGDNRPGVHNKRSDVGFATACLPARRAVMPADVKEGGGVLGRSLRGLGITREQLAGSRKAAHWESHREPYAQRARPAPSFPCRLAQTGTRSAARSARSPPRQRSGGRPGRPHSPAPRNPAHPDRMASCPRPHGEPAGPEVLPPAHRETHLHPG